MEARAEDWRMQEGPGDDEPLADARISGERLDGPPGALPVDEIEDRALLASSLRPSAFPADRDALIEVAREQHAEPRVLTWLDALPAGVRFENVQRVWDALGGHAERREQHHEAPRRQDREPARAEATATEPSATRATPPAPAAEPRGAAPDVAGGREEREEEPAAPSIVDRVVDTGLRAGATGVGIAVGMARRIRRILP